MQHYHLYSKGIREYINKLKEAQAKVERANNLITDATLVIIATNAMLSAEKFPWSNEDWEELDVAQCTWARRKTAYCAAAKKLVIKKKAADGK